MFLIFILSLVTISAYGAVTFPPKSRDLVQKTQISQVPYLVQLREDGKFICSGTLVYPQYVVTAATCVEETHPIVVGGASTITEEGCQRKISKVSIHPNYGSDGQAFNAALLKLDQPMLGENISTIELSQEAVQENDHVHIWGWGQNAYDKLPAELRTAGLVVTPQERCERNFLFSPGEKVGVFCASDVNQCYADEGGPAICYGKLCGIVALYGKCNNTFESLGITSVFDIRDFIESAMK